MFIFITNHLLFLLSISEYIMRVNSSNCSWICSCAYWLIFAIRYTKLFILYIHECKINDIITSQFIYG